MINEVKIIKVDNGWTVCLCDYAYNENAPKATFVFHNLDEAIAKAKRGLE